MPQQKKPVPPNHRGKAAPQASKGKSKDLLDLEENGSNCSASSVESKLLFCKNDDFLQPRIADKGSLNIPDKKPNICAVPESNVLGKLKDFLGVISEANKRLDFDAKDDTEKYDIEVLNGNESEYIEMDLMLGVADLHTPDAIAAAESAMAGYQPTVSLAAGCGSDEDNDDDDSEDNDDNDDIDGSDDEKKLSKDAGENENSSGESLRNQQSKKRQKIIELS